MKRLSGMITVMSSRVGAYLLPGDPVWMRSSLSRYYEALDDLVVLVPTEGMGWTGRPIPVDACLSIIEKMDVRGIARRVEGRWVDKASPMRADTAQRQAGLDALVGEVDWVLQIDNDEVLPDVVALVELLDSVDEDTVAVEWPMRVLYRHLGGTRYLGVSTVGGDPVFEYPGAIAIRPTARLDDARALHQGAILRLAVHGDSESLQLRQSPREGERRIDSLAPEQAIVHNSWGRSPSEIWRKTRTWGHAAGIGGVLYFVMRWLPSPLTWRWLHNVHPFADGLWPRLRPVTVPPQLVHPDDRC